MSRVTACFINLPAKVPDIFQVHSRTEKSEERDIIEIILDGLKVAKHGTQCLT